MTARLDLNVRDELIEQYFKLGYDHAEIPSCLLLLHDQELGLRQLKRILACRRLKRRQNVSDLRTVIVAIEEEQQGSGIDIGLLGKDWSQIAALTRQITRQIIIICHGPLRVS